MTRDDVIRLAREVGADITGFINYDYGEEMVLFHPKELEHFAVLVIEESRKVSTALRYVQKTQEIVQDPAEIRRVFELDDAEYPEPESGFMKL